MIARNAALPVMLVVRLSCTSSVPGRRVEGIDLEAKSMAFRASAENSHADKLSNQTFLCISSHLFRRSLPPFGHRLCLGNPSRFGPLAKWECLLVVYVIN